MHYICHYFFFLFSAVFKKIHFIGYICISNVSIVEYRESKCIKSKETCLVEKSMRSTY